VEAPGKDEQTQMNGHAKLQEDEFENSLNVQSLKTKDDNVETLDMDIRMDSQAAKFSDKEIHLHVKYCIG
jgi:hypothetical protein